MAWGDKMGFSACPSVVLARALCIHEPGERGELFHLAVDAEWMLLLMTSGCEVTPGTQNHAGRGGGTGHFTAQCAQCPQCPGALYPHMYGAHRASSLGNRWMGAARPKLTSHVPLVKLSWSIPMRLGCGRVLPLAEVGVSPLGLCFV